jgi:hypothetical protein
MGFGVDTRDVALTTVGVAVLQVPTAAWLTHTWGCPAFFITEPIVDDELGAVPSDCCDGPFAERATAGEAAVVITPPATRSIVVPGFESCEVAGTDFKVLSDIFIRDACPPGAACVNKVVFCPEMTFNVCCPCDVLTPSVPCTTDPAVSCFPDVWGDGWPTKNVP